MIRIVWNKYQIGLDEYLYEWNLCNLIPITSALGYKDICPFPHVRKKRKKVTVKLSLISKCKLLHKQERKIVLYAQPDIKIVGMNERHEMRGLQISNPLVCLPQIQI